MPQPLRALVVEDSNDDAVLMTREIARGGFEVSWTRVETAAQMEAALREGVWDVVLSDYSLPAFNAPEVLDVLKRSGLDLPVIVVSGSIPEESAVDLMRRGAHDYILKHNLKRLSPAIERELREAENRRAARQAEDRHRLLVETIPHMVWMTDAAGSTTYVNQRGAEHIGVAAESIHGLAWLALIHPGDAQAVQQIWARSVRSGEGYRAEYRLRQADGSYRWYLSQAVPLRRADGQVEAWVGTWTDIDDRKQAEQALQISEERFRQIAESIREVFWLTDPGKGEMVYVSPAYEAIWQRSRTTLYESPREWLDAVHPDDRTRVLDAAMTRQAAGGYDEEYRIVRPDGTVRWIRDRAFPVKDASGAVIRVAGVAEDITERRDLEVQLRQAQKMEAIGQLAAGVAHDFNNLLTIITGYGDMLFEQFEPDDPKRELLEEIRQAGARSVALTRQLLAFSRKQMLAPAVFDINDVVRATERMLLRVIGEDVRLVTALEATTGRIAADQGQFEQVLLNLALNARDAMPGGGTLSIATADVLIDDGDVGGEGLRPGQYARLTVADTGAGMTDEVKRHVFEPFFTTKGPGKGTGLGLAVVHGFVRQSHGHVELESAPGRGTTFRILLPAVDRPLPPGAAGAAAPAPRGTETILLVEDEDGVRALARRILEGHGYTVIEAPDGAAALRAARAYGGPIDLLITDLVMPGLNGRALAEQLVAGRPALKVLYMSGYTDDAVVRHGIQQDDVNFLGKPFAAAALARKVRSVLSR